MSNEGSFGSIKVKNTSNFQSPKFIIPKTYYLLLVDDDEMIQRVLPEVIRLAVGQLNLSERYEILQAMNGEQGLILFNQYRSSIKVIFTDFEMPLLTGPQMVNAIRASEGFEGKNVLIVGLTG